MDDYRDLVTASLALVCAGIMLVAGQLYIEQHPGLLNRPVEPPQQPQTSPALISHAPAPQENAADPHRRVEKNRTG
ncbi:hypothetical protein [Bradyrhizobium sp. BR 10289]|uniref:hypothetical protein n=1 Tax=Bradyrhizobium sp. BR 10289 TaxID=2749993 RepID=UPI001C652ED9|nr:hypothetical protein [Bradyrhizobium sp. BR 10289]MBW7971018.1 hypothetical protein [Bradyrhizobium sp. BR 10289]